MARRWHSKNPVAGAGADAGQGIGRFGRKELDSTALPKVEYTNAYLDKLKRYLIETSRRIFILPIGSEGKQDLDEIAQYPRH